MLKIKNKTFQPIQISLRSANHSSLETVVLPSRAELMIEEDLSTSMIDNLEKRGFIVVRKVK